MNLKIAVWFSCGAASAVAAKLTLEQYPGCDVRIVNNPVVEEHPDNERFLKDVANWLGRRIEFATSSEYPNASAVEVWEKRKYMAGVGGAPCTMILKKHARQEWERMHRPDYHVLGFTTDELSRLRRFIQTERGNVLPVLIAAGYDKQMCYDRLVAEGIQPPAMYELGYPNANCIGCVKAASPTYWNHVRKTHPEVFAQRAAQSRKIGAKLVNVRGERIYLDELEPGIVGRPMKTMKVDCGIFCEEEDV